MRNRIVALALLALPATAMAQAQRVEPNRLPTTWTEIDQPLNAMLDDGWRIIAMTGPGFTLERRGKFALCQVFPASGRRPETTSECHGLN
ncbi:hypothetical protein HMPREF9946_03882 [Acetobacteraceae bacterium AT-5844]|nr:hypothetical protein HMPREF9946_03882 [Acetobacteraceae bacterium AT-5844]